MLSRLLGFTGGSSVRNPPAIAGDPGTIPGSGRPPEEEMAEHDLAAKRLPQMKTAVAANLLSHVQLCATPWTVAHQPPLSMGFSKREYWSGVPCPPLGDLPDPRIDFLHCRQILYHLSHRGTHGPTRGTKACDSLWQLRFMLRL